MSFAIELSRLGDIIGRSAGDLRRRLSKIAELKEKLDAQQLVLNRMVEALREHRAWFDGYRDRLAGA